jgi:hypothetical protein
MQPATPVILITKMGRSTPLLSPITAICLVWFVLTYTPPGLAQQTCNARCPDGSMSETFNCNSNYVPACLRRTPTPSDGVSPNDKGEASRARAEATERQNNADAADQRGIEALNSRDWQEAANQFMSALEFSPDNEEIRAHLEQARAGLAAARQQTENVITIANIRSERLNFETRAAELPSSLDGGHPVMYPTLRRPVSPNSPSAKVLGRSQSKILAVDQEIRRVQKALRQLIESNQQGEDERLEWIKASQEATIDAQDLSISLVIDLFGAHVDDLAKTNKEERAIVLDHLLTRTEENGGNSIHSAYGALVNRKEEIERLKQAAEQAGKHYDNLDKAKDLSSYRYTQPIAELLWEVVNKFDTVDELAGPSKDLLGAAYTIYSQAVSFQRLSMIQSNNEKTLQAAAVLSCYIVKLEEQKQGTTANSDPCLKH